MLKKNGFAILEVMISIVIVSFGLIGIAALIANGLKSNYSSNSRSQATWLANDIIDSMRANRNQANLNPSPYNVALGTDPSGTGVPMQDLRDWKNKVEKALPSGAGSVSVSADKVVVTIQWDNSKVKRGSSSQRLVVETKL